MPAELWVRAETKPSEHRAPLTPEDAGALIAQGLSVTVESSPRRIFPDAAYEAAGCRLAEPGAWQQAGSAQVVVGLKDLPPEIDALRHRHVYFGHAYKKQQGSAELLRRFVRGRGELLDLEYLVDDRGRRLVTFGYWAGYVGAALAVLRWRGGLDAPLKPSDRASLDAALAGGSGRGRPRVLVVGAEGRCGRGARDALAVAGVTPLCWDVEETRTLDRAALLDVDILVNTVLVSRPVPPFLLPEQLAGAGRRLSLVVDVSCDVGSPCNVLPVYDRTTDWNEPVRRVYDGPRPLDVIAIDNLPSLLPAEASRAFSRALAPLLARLDDDTAPWRACRGCFLEACVDLDPDLLTSPVRDV